MAAIDAVALAAVLREAVSDPLVATIKESATTITAAIKASTTSITTTMEAGVGKTHDLLEQVLLQKAGNVKPIRAAVTNPIKKEKKKRSKATTGYRLYLKDQKVNMSSLTMEEGEKLAEAAAAEFAILKPALEAGAADSNPADAAAGPPATDGTRETEPDEPLAAWLTAGFRAAPPLPLREDHLTRRHYVTGSGNTAPAVRNGDWSTARAWHVVVDWRDRRVHSLRFRSCRRECARGAHRYPVCTYRPPAPHHSRCAHLWGGAGGCAVPDGAAGGGSRQPCATGDRPGGVPGPVPKPAPAACG